MPHHSEKGYLVTRAAIQGHPGFWILVHRCTISGRLCHVRAQIEPCHRRASYRYSWRRECRRGFNTYSEKAGLETAKDFLLQKVASRCTGHEFYTTDTPPAGPWETH